MSSPVQDLASRTFRRHGVTLQRYGLAAMLLGFGYFLGSLELLQPRASVAQPPAGAVEEEELPQIELSNEAVRQLQLINESLNSAMETLRVEGQYTSATETVNPYLVLTGGGNAIDDLERGIGVDPFTFAALYAGQAVREVRDELSKDEQGRLLYKNRLIRIYSVERLKQRELTRQAIIEKRLLPQ